jgi:glycosyltransferase involved in cell wall biosynthesis
MSEQDYPKVLIIGQEFGSVRGGQITLSNLFHGWPAGRLADVSSTHEYFCDDSICKLNYNLGSDEDRWTWPLSLFERTGKISGPVSAHDNLVKVEQNNTELNQRISRRMFYAMIKFLGINHMLRSYHLSPKLNAWVNDFGPDVIYTQLSSLPIIHLVSSLVSATGAPLVIHIMDDWPSTVYSSGLFSPVVRRMTDAGFRSLLGKASLRLGICDAMCRAYEKRYQFPFVPFHNPVDMSVWSGIARKDWRVGEPFRMQWRGRLAYYSDPSLLEVCDLVSELTAEGHRIQLDIYTPDISDEVKKKFERPGCVLVHPAGSLSSYPGELVKADLLLLAFAFDKRSIQFIRYSMSTKMAEYMASGVPILIYAPRELAMVEYLIEEKCSYAVAKHDQEILKEAIMRLSSETDLREELSQRAQKVAAKKYDAQAIRSAFKEVLIQAIK